MIGYIFVISLNLLFFSCAGTSEKQNHDLSPSVHSESSNQEIKHLESPVSLNSNELSEQISCEPGVCTEIEYTDYNELDDNINTLMETGAGKILIRMRYYDKRLNDEEIQNVLEYLREISKREGKVSVEPYYIGHRGLIDHIPVLKDAGIRLWDIYTRVKNKIKYKETKNYNAKVLYHPKDYNVMMFFFIHKNFGDVCDTIYSSCKVLEYIDDETFDLALSRALDEATKKGQSVKVDFNQQSANLPEFKISLETLKNTNNSVRMYKWFVASKETEKKSLVKQRFIPASLVVSLIDYTMTAYDAIQAYIMYKPARKMKAEVLYSGKEEGGKIESVVFTPVLEGEG